jgi:hypothetical protein
MTAAEIAITIFVILGVLALLYRVAEILFWPALIAIVIFFVLLGLLYLHAHTGTGFAIPGMH